MIIADTSTAILTAAGRMDNSGEVLTFKGEMDDAMAGKRPVKYTLHLEGGVRRRVEAYDTLPDGKEFKVLETTYTRAE